VRKARDPVLVCHCEERQRWNEQANTPRPDGHPSPAGFMQSTVAADVRRLAGGKRANSASLPRLLHQPDSFDCIVPAPEGIFERPGLNPLWERGVAQRRGVSLHLEIL